MKRADAGLTLIELVVAMSVFALVAIMGLQSLTGTLRGRDRAAVFAEQSIALGQAVGLLRQDLAAALPVLFYPPGGERGVSAMRADPGGDGFAFSIAITQHYESFVTGRLAGRVEYRLDPQSGRLSRASWSTAWPVNAGSRSPDATVMEGVRGLRLRSFWDGVGWINGLRITGLGQTAETSSEEEGQDGAETPPEVYSDAVPMAVEITLITDEFGEITLLETLQ